MKTREEKIASAMQLSQKVTDLIGIPLEFEDIYDFIGFLPSRMHNAGSLTKYWAHGQNGFKLRGIEARQHSTCEWIAAIQKESLEILKDNLNGESNYDSITVQQKIIAKLHDEIKSLNSGKIDPKKLVVTRRVTKRIEDFSVSTNTQQALIRARRLGQDILPGRKVRFVATTPSPGIPESRVILLEELADNSGFRIDSEYYEGLAIRAIWAILGPFGWSDEEIRQGHRKYTLFDFFSAFDSNPSINDSAY